MTGFDDAMAALSAELQHWPGHHLTDVSAGCSYGSHAPDGTWGKGGASYVQTLTGWCATVVADGWEGERDRYFEWGKTIPDAIAKVAEYLTSRRTNPHLHHILECDFADGCELCADEERRLADGTL